MHLFKRIISFSILFLIVSYYSNAQENKLRIKILDESQNVLAFANVFNLNTKKGNTSNFDGFTLISYENISDSIQISYIGFNVYKNSIAELIKNPNIILVSKIEAIPMVEVSEESDFLYELIQSCKKTKTSHLDTAKTYFLLKTKHENKEVEHMEAYYNGIYQSYDLLELQLKKARVALDTISENRFFVSQETSKVIGLIKTFENSPYFPVQALELNKKELKKRYQLDYLSSFRNEKGHLIYEIEAKPKKEGFYTRILINMDRKFFEKVKLIYNNAGNSPFKPIWESDELEKIDFEIEKTFFQKNGIVFPKSIHFFYDLTYINSLKKSYRIHTEAVLYPYDYDTSFNLPHFDFKNIPSDYSKVFGLPYDTNFWQFNEEFKLNAEQEENPANWMIETPKYFKNRLEESKYQPWKGEKNRILLRNLDPIVENNLGYPKNAAIKTDLYNLKVQWYFDYNYMNDSLYIQLYSIFDPFQSFYKLDIDNTTLAYINMYFDLYETYRRQLELELNSSKSINLLFSRRLKEMEQLIEKFNKEVQRGENLNQMLFWNNIILNELGIDNISIFGLSNNKQQNDE